MFVGGRTGLFRSTLCISSFALRSNRLFCSESPRFGGEVKLDKEALKAKRSTTAWEAKKEELERQKEFERNLVEETGRKIAKVGRVSPLGETKRWFKRASVEQFTTRDDRIRYRPLLDDRIILTPESKMLWAPSHILAAAVALEWEAQADFVTPHMMPLMGMCCTALDSMPINRGHAISTMLGFLQTDSLCFRASEKTATKLYNNQVRLHQPIIDWFQRKFDANVEVVQHGMIAFPNQSDVLMHKVRWFLHQATDWELTSLYVLTENAKSFLIALAVFDKFINSEQALRASRTEEDFQIEINGFVEAEHDVTEATLLTHLSSASFFGHVVAGLEK